MRENLVVNLIGLSGALSVFLFAISLLPTKSALSKKLGELEARRARGGPPTLARSLERVLGEEQRGKLESSLQQAGWYRSTPAHVLLRSVAGLAGGLGISLAFAYFTHIPTISCMLMAVGLMTAGAYAPFWQLNAAVLARKSAVNRHLPDLLDLVATMVRAGLSVNASLAQAVEAMPNALGEEVKAALSEIRLGRSRAEALMAMAERVKQEELTTVVTAIVQAEKLGANIAHVLSEAADDARHHRLLSAEEAAAKLPVKLVFPMAFCLMPAMYIIIFTPLVANLLVK